MRRIAQAGVKAPKLNKAAKALSLQKETRAAQKMNMAKKYKVGGVKKAQTGIKNFDFSDENPYKGGPGVAGFPGRFMSGAYEAQPWVKAKRAEQKRRAGLTNEQRDIEKVNVQRITTGKAGPQAMSGKLDNKQRKGGVTKKAKAKYGVKKTASKRSK